MGAGEQSVPESLRVDRSAVFEVLPTPYVVLSTDLVVLDANPAYLAVTGRSREDLIGAQFLAAFPPPPESLGPDGRSELQVSLERVRDTGLADTLPVQKYPIAGPDGVLTERHWLAVHVPVLDSSGRVLQLVQRTEDITEFSLERDRVTMLAEQRDDAGDSVWRARAERVEADLFTRARELADAVAAKDAAARQVASLAEIALALTSASSLAEVEQIVVGRGLPVLGSDGGGIVSPDERGGWRITVNAALGEQVQITYPDAPHDSMIPGCYTARTGERLLLPTRAAGFAYDREVMAGIYASTQRLGWAFLPLVVGERRLGSLAVSWVQEHHFLDDELDILAAFAAQCAQALLRVETENAQLAAAREVQQLSESLQQALLTPPPEPDHLHIVVRYRPAGHHAQVGGDWYDAFLQPGGATMVVIGDVVGHDSVAAAKMGQLRGVLRTLAYDADRRNEPDTPATILTRLEHAARGLAVNTMATTILGRIEQPVDRPGSPRIMRWANAGHLPPVLLHSDGTVHVLDTKPDLLLGVDPDTERHDHVVELPDDSTLLLYTDGLIERREISLDVSIDRLCAALADLATAGVDELCDTLLDRLAADSGEDDDIALLAVRAYSERRPRPAVAGDEQLPEIEASVTPPAAADPAAPPGQSTVPATVIELPFGLDAPSLARRFVAQHSAQLPAERRYDAELLVSELVTNAVRYGAPSITLRVNFDPPGIGVAITDRGAELPILPDGRPDPDSPSGRGMLIIATVADSWGITPSSDGIGKTVWFELRSAGSAGPDGSG